VIGDGLPRLALRKQNFLLANHLEIIIKESSENAVQKYCLFYQGHYMYSSIDYEESLLIYSYLYNTDGSLNKPLEHFKNKFQDARNIQQDLREHIIKSRFGFLVKDADSDGLLIGWNKTNDFQVSYKGYKDGLQYTVIAFFFSGFLIFMLAPYLKKLTVSDTLPDTEKTTEDISIEPQKVLISESKEPNSKEVEEWVPPKISQHNLRTLHKNLKTLLVQSVPDFETQLRGYINFHSTRKNMNTLIYNPNNKSFTRSPVQVFSLQNFPEGISVKIEHKF
jgi:hypothetical protein